MDWKGRIQPVCKACQIQLTNCSGLEVVDGMDVEDNVTSPGEDDDSNPSSNAEEEGV